jgi:MoxR-like ATPase
MATKPSSYTETLEWANIDSPWKLATAAINAGVTRLFLSGAPGIGKSHLGAFGFGNRPYYQVTESDDLSVQEQIGHFVPRGNVFEWHDGPFARAMREGALLIINEINRASDAVKDMLLGVLDDPAIASIALPSGEKLSPAPGFTVIATSNEPISALDPALQDRFEVALTLDSPNPALIQRLNYALTGLGDAVADSYKDPGREISPRRALAFVALRDKKVAVKTAAVMAFGERAPDICDVLQSRGMTL